MKRRELEKILRELRWKLLRHGGKHDVWGNGDREIVVPRHIEINEYTARAIIEDAKGEKR
ncbi:MAG: type II toxin-antitoxin system HicA family toxin [Candidatus Aminicenantes bacterium]|nr:type II toxin-antitoxin system HicA family toxin [Candidatus Aminicenantes bacterium]